MISLIHIANIKGARRKRSLPGFTLIEALISIVIVASIIISSLSTLAMTGKSNRYTQHQIIAPMLAQMLMSEILSLPYEEPVDVVSFGREISESSVARTTWDDVDDYHGWTDNPPQQKDTTALTQYGGWTRTVEVVWVQPTDLTLTSVTETGVKRITISISKNGVVFHALTAVRTNMWSNTIDESLPPM